MRGPAKAAPAGATDPARLGPPWRRPRGWKSDARRMSDGIAKRSAPVPCVLPGPALRRGVACPETPDRAAARFKAGTWAEKIAANRVQAEHDQAELRARGWQVETVWECQVDQPKAVDALAERLLRR